MFALVVLALVGAATALPGYGAGFCRDLHTNCAQVRLTLILAKTHFSQFHLVKVMKF